MNDGMQMFDLLTYAFPIWFLTGVVLLWHEAAGYKIAGMTKEYIATKCLGIINLCAGTASLILFLLVKLLS